MHFCENSCLKAVLCGKGLKQSKVLIPVSWVLLDSGSTVSSICNADLFDNILGANVTTNVHTNGGSKD